ncbi:hypothetical protein H696_03663 [Fonticula alba]|uniref:Uncharacterized protein n=1 Tax=Fonticula alba TaxID=691883 RepID=A0A058Z7C5_FONAL|nr:hypothetical protein H696_03663 [Fonticula alba]KCV70204.1 hypothetical protein H696_03663 [Fonticula alba]|eukprot:XP_009495810.1 hypothetical protein H696_03663 [Fonticula alba]
MSLVQGLRSTAGSTPVAAILDLPCQLAELATAVTEKVHFPKECQEQDLYQPPGAFIANVPCR